VRSSRKIERATYEDVAFRYLAANQHPDHNTIARFRERNLDVLEGLFIQGLKIAEQMGLVKLGRVAIDGTKIRAHASKHTYVPSARASNPTSIPHSRGCRLRIHLSAPVAHDEIRDRRLLTDCPQSRTRDRLRLRSVWTGARSFRRVRCPSLEHSVDDLQQLVGPRDVSFLLPPSA
jgi:Transposase domain (DUF772)